MAPQIKQDLNRAGWETTDFPSVCETCLGGNPFVKMLKEDYGAECKLCTRPFSIFSFSVDRAQGRKKRTNICLTCARLKNCCQCCMLDLSFGLPIVVRDAALKMVAPGPSSDINREYFAQNNERAIEEGQAGVEEYSKQNEKSIELLRALANSKPYNKTNRGPRYDTTSHSSTPHGNSAIGAGVGGPGPVRTSDSRAAAAVGAGPTRKARLGVSQPPPGPNDWLPPSDRKIMSLFVTGIEDDLPEFKIRDFFKVYGKIKSLVCSHMTHCAFINYETREAAEAAAASCQGKAVISGCPLRVRWGIPKAVGVMDKDKRAEMLRDGRRTLSRPQSSHRTSDASLSKDAHVAQSTTVAPPPGADEPRYEALNGE